MLLGHLLSVLKLSSIFFTNSAFLCRGKKKKPSRYTGSREGFQKLNDKDYSDSEEENIEFDR